MIATEITDTIDISETDFQPVIGERQYFLQLVNSREFKEGEAAFARGLTTRNNPYRFRSSEYWRWQEGLLGNCYPRQSQITPAPDRETEGSGDDADDLFAPARRRPR